MNNRIKFIGRTILAFLLIWIFLLSGNWFINFIANQGRNGFLIVLLFWAIGCSLVLAKVFGDD